MRSVSLQSKCKPKSQCSTRANQTHRMPMSINNDRLEVASTGFTPFMGGRDRKVLGVMIEGFLKGLVPNCPLFGFAFVSVV